MTLSSAPLLDWGWAGAPLEGVESGDLHVVVADANQALVAVIDGLGHGPDAALAAREASALLQAHATYPLEQIVQECHDGLRSTRGVVMSLAVFDRRRATVDWCGVGNVDGILFRADVTLARARESLATRGGVVGYRLPPLKVACVPVYPGDVLVLASDGIRSDFADAVDVRLPVQEMADVVFGRCGRATDDALVLAARYLGGAP